LENSVSSKTIKQLEIDFRRADRISDADLTRLFQHFNAVESLLAELGERWHFAWNEARRIRDDCGDYINNRREHDRKFGPPGTAENLLNKCGHLRTYKCAGAACEYLNHGPEYRRVR
jgi:hypothetical protein